MARRIMALALVGAILFQGAQASMFMDASLELFEGMAADITNIGTYTLWASKIIYYSLVAPLLAPILGSVLARFYDGTLSISGVALDEALAIAGLHTEEYAFFFLMDSV